MKRFVFLLSLVAVTGCQTQMRMLETSGDLRVEPSTVSGSDYVVHLRNTVDFGFNPDDEANRHRTALNLLKSQCPTGKVVKDTVINTGTYGFGKPARLYSVYVKCA